MLSKWWATPSAQAAFKRVEEERKRKIEEMKAKIAAKKEREAKELSQWQEVPLKRRQKASREA